MNNRILIVLLSLSLVGGILYVGQPVLVPLALALLIWHVVDASGRALVNLLPSARRAFFLPGVHMAIIALLSVVFVSLARWLATGLDGIRGSIPHYVNNLNGLLAELAARIGLQGGRELEIGILMGELDMAALVSGLFSSLGTLLGYGGAVLLYLVFLLLEQRMFPLKLHALFRKPEHHDKALRVLTEVGHEVRSYLWIKSTISLLTAVLSVLLLLWVGLDFALFWGILIFALNFIPYLGSLIATILPASMALAQFGGLGPFLVLLAGLGIIQVSVGNVLEPRLMGRGLNLSPLVILIALAGWGTLWGGAGMFLSVPLMVVLMIVFSHIPATQPVAILMSADGQLRASAR